MISHSLTFHTGHQAVRSLVPVAGLDRLLLPLLFITGASTLRSALLFRPPVLLCAACRTFGKFGRCNAGAVCLCV